MYDFKDCKTCENRVFDEESGRYVCKTYKHTVKDADKYVGCVGYKEKK